MTIEGPQRPPMPRRLVLAYMAGLSLAARRSAQCYLEALDVAAVVAARLTPQNERT